jgi:hypothetical protein
VPSHEDRRERRFFASVLVTAALVVVAALALAFVLGAHHDAVTTLRTAGTAVPSGRTTPQEGAERSGTGPAEGNAIESLRAEHGRDGNRTPSLVAQSVNGGIRPAGDGVGHRFRERGWGDRGSLRRPGRRDILDLVPGDGAAALWFAALRAGLHHHGDRYLQDPDL